MLVIHKQTLTYNYFLGCVVSNCVNITVSRYKGTLVLGSNKAQHRKRTPDTNTQLPISRYYLSVVLPGITYIIYPVKHASKTREVVSGVELTFVSNSNILIEVYYYLV